MYNSVPTMAPIEFINITPYNPLISKCQIKVCWVGDEPNPNRSIISKATATELANSIPGSPIVGHYNQDTGDFEQHNKLIEIKNGKFSLKADTFPYGFVDLNAKVWFQQFDDGGIIREYLVTEGWLWTGQFPECKRVINKGNNQSMELDQDMIDAHWTKDVNGNKEFFIINEAIMSKLCILGEDFKPCFEGANITAPKIEFSLGENFEQQMLFMMNEIKTILSEGGTSMLDNENNQVAAEPANEPAEPTTEAPTSEPSEPATEPAAEPTTDFADNKDDEKVCPECGKPIDECTCKNEGEPEKEDDEDKKTKYDLNEIPEYMEILDKCSALEAQVNEFNATIESLKAENESLASFKAGIEKAEKETLIKNFYMLTDEDKQDVVDNIDTYSLDEIEAKLSILCVRKKVSFNLDEDNKDNNPTLYNLNNQDYSNDSAPDWVKSLRENAKNI